jgi:endonuclease YncB( thermonuclease family)
MTGSQDNNDRYDDDDLYGPSESDLERFNGEDRRPESPGTRRIRNALWKLIAGLVITFLIASMLLNVIVPVIGGNQEVTTRPQRVPATVTRIFDGRTIAVEIDGVERTVRYIGLDIPEYSNFYYELAIEANRQWIHGQEVLLESDRIETDSEGRLLCYVWFDDAMINLNLIASGLARASVADANNRYADYFHDLEEQARSRNIGIWDTGTTAGTSYRKLPSSTETGLSRA